MRILCAYVLDYQLQTEFLHGDKFQQPVRRQVPKLGDRMQSHPDVDQDGLEAGRAGDLKKTTLLPAESSRMIDGVTRPHETALGNIAVGITLTHTYQGLSESCTVSFSVTSGLSLGP